MLDKLLVEKVTEQPITRKHRSDAAHRIKWAPPANGSFRNIFCR